jgi:tetratricopeptide (TPR) repeat protein
MFRDYSAYYPNDYLGWFYRGTPLMMIGRTEEAIESLKKAAEIDPAKLFAPAQIARFDLIFGNFDDAAKWIQHLRRYGHAQSADLAEGESDFLQGRLQQSQECFARLTLAKNPLYRSYGYSLLARLFAEQGKYEDSFDAIEGGLREDIQSGDISHRADKMLDRAYLRCRAKQYGNCLQDTNAALNLDRSLQRSLSAATLLGQAAFEAEASVKARIARELRNIEGQLPLTNLKPMSDIVRAHAHGERLLAEGRWQQALDEFRKADRQEAVNTDKEYLGRALLSASRHAADEASARQLRDEALRAYSVLAKRPGLVWQWALAYPAGIINTHVTVLNHL